MTGRGSGRTSGRDSGRGSRRLKVKLRTARGRTISSTRWLQRQLNDPYVADARRAGYRARSAWKLIQLDDKLHLLKPGARVVDLGAAPGGWTQVAVERVGPGGQIIAVDCNEMAPVDGATFLHLDLTDADALDRIRSALNGPVDVVLSDMAAPVTGHRQTDHVRTVALCEAAAEFAGAVLRPGGSFVTKVFQGGAEGTLLAELKRTFAQVRHVKPPASRDSSPETYLVATGFRG